MVKVNDELVALPPLEMALEFVGAWDYQILLPPPMTILCAECEDAPISLEVYALDPDRHKGPREAARDHVAARLRNVTVEEYSRAGQAVFVRAMGYEGDLPTELFAQAIHAHDAHYVLSFSGWPASLEPEQWRIQAMLGATTFGQHRPYGRGVTGLARMVEAHLSESDVVLGRSRAQFGFVRAQATVRRGKPTLGGVGDAPHAAQAPPPTSAPDPWASVRPASPPKPPGPRLDPWTQARAGSLSDALQGAPQGLPKQAPDVGAESIFSPSHDLRDFERRLSEGGAARGDDAKKPPPRRWPAPWEPVPNFQEGTAGVDPELLRISRGPTQSRELREAHLLALADRLPGKVAVYAEKVRGTPGSFEVRAQEVFGVAGLERVPLLLDALLRMRQGELSGEEPLTLGPPRRALSPWGHALPDGALIPTLDALGAMVAQDDATAADLVGWRLGWKVVQERLAAFGLARHSVLSPARARLLAWTDLEGPFQGLDLGRRVAMWKGLDEEGRRATLGQLHNAHLETPLEEIEGEFMACVTDPSTPREVLARWDLALGPRGCAQEYGALFAALARGQALGGPADEQARTFLRPCAGDALSGVTPGVELQFGKQGQSLGVLCAGGVLGRLQGDEVALCVLVRDIQTDDRVALVEQTRILAGLVYEHVLKS